MKKRMLLLLIAVCFLFCGCNEKEPDELDQILESVEQALPQEFKKQFQTEVLSFDFKDENSNLMTYYICATTFYEADRSSVTGLHTEAITAVFDVENAECILEFDAHGHPAAIYSWEGNHYACCTSTPEASAVLQYAPEALDQQTAMKIIRSIFVNLE